MQSVRPQQGKLVQQGAPQIEVAEAVRSGTRAAGLHRVRVATKQTRVSRVKGLDPWTETEV